MINFTKTKLWGCLLATPIVLGLLFPPMEGFAEKTNQSDIYQRENRQETLQENHLGTRQEAKPETKQINDNDPVTQKEFKEFKDNYEKEARNKITKNETIKKIEEKFSEKEDFFNFLLIITGLATAAAIVGIGVSVNATNRLNKIQGNYVKEEKLQKLEHEIKELRQKLDDIKFKNETVITAYVPPTVEISHSTIRQNPTTKSQNAPIDPIVDFLAEYHKIYKMNNFEAKEFRKNLMIKYHLKSFYCANSADRIQIPPPPPIYSDTDPMKAQVWAYPLPDGTFAVVPRIPQTYDKTLHIPGAMCEMFDSNFENGMNYNNIEVLKPAIFADGWRMVQKGKLKLS